MAASRSTPRWLIGLAVSLALFVGGWAAALCVSPHGPGNSLEDAVRFVFIVLPTSSLASGVALIFAGCEGGQRNCNRKGVGVLIALAVLYLPASLWILSAAAQ
jgi:ABC-type spermidine/putrescine transport system permease subunit II